MKPENRLYVEAEGVIRQTESDVIDRLTELHEEIQNRLREATGHENISGNWQGRLWIWKTQTDNWFIERKNVSF